MRTESVVIEVSRFIDASADVVAVYPQCRVIAAAVEIEVDDVMAMLKSKHHPNDVFVPSVTTFFFGW